jgi:hypothetical protein
MKSSRLYSLALLIFSLLVVSCQKTDQPVGLPEKTGSKYAMVEMGEDYTDQVFYDFETNRIVYVSPIKSWDLAFETSAMGYHIFINGGGRNIFVHNTHETDITKEYSVPKLKDNEWDVDQDCGLPDSTAVGEWQTNNISKGEVYILKIDPYLFPDSFVKVKFLAVTDDKYLFSYGNLKSSTVKTVTITKNPEYNYAYFSFDKNDIVMPEPPKNTWDIVFTRFRHIYHELDEFTYPVNGVLNNPYNTTAAADSSVAYEKVTNSMLPSLKFLNRRDVIGFDWKYFNRDQAGAIAKYIVQRNKIYFVKTRNEQYYKLHFLDFYNSQGVKGSPSFEYERLQ